MMFSILFVSLLMEFITMAARVHPTAPWYSMYVPLRGTRYQYVGQKVLARLTYEVRTYEDFSEKMLPVLPVRFYR
jgi:hypothetical protein